MDKGALCQQSPVKAAVVSGYFDHKAAKVFRVRVAKNTLPIVTNQECIFCGFHFRVKVARAGTASRNAVPFRQSAEILMRAENAARNSDSGFHEVAPSASNLTLARTPLLSSGTSYLELAELLAGLSGQWERPARARRISDRLCVVLLLAMCREGGRAHEFICDDTNYGDPDEFDLLSDPPMADEVLIRLAKTLGMLKSFTFICDYGAIGSIGSRSRMRSRPIRNGVGSYAWTDRAPASQRRLMVHFVMSIFLSQSTIH